MKKSIFGVLAILIFNVFAGAALAVPMLNTASGNDYFTASSITFQNQFENVGFEADFGLFSMADPTQKYEIFSYDDEPGFLSVENITATDWTPLAEGFGFYFDVHIDGASDSVADFTWFSDSSLNQFFNGTLVDTGVEHIRIESRLSSVVQVSLDNKGNGNYNDRNVMGFSCSMEPVAPVPEPATVLLFGTGLVALVGRNNFRKKA